MQYVVSYMLRYYNTVILCMLSFWPADLPAHRSTAACNKHGPRLLFVSCTIPCVPVQHLIVARTQSRECCLTDCYCQLHIF